MTTYRLLRKLFEAASAETFIAQQLDAQPLRPVVVHRSPASEAWVLKGAACDCVGLRHPHLLEVLDVGTLGGRQIQVQEFVDGVTFRELLTAASQQKVWPDLRETCFVMQSLAEAVAKVRERCGPGILIPISAERVLIDALGQVKLLLPVAFLDKRLGESPLLAALSSHSAVAPEQLKGQEPDARSDVFLLGLLMYELLTSRPLFHLTSGLKGLEELAKLDVMRLVPMQGIPPEFNPVVLQSLVTTAEHRFASARDFADSMGDFVVSQTGPVSSDDIAKMFKAVFPGHVSLLERGTPVPNEELTIDTPNKPVVASGFVPREPVAPPTGAATLGRMVPRRITAEELKAIRAEEEAAAREAAQAMPDGAITVPPVDLENESEAPFEQRLGHVLIKHGKADPEGLRSAWATWQQVKGRFVDVLVDRGVITDEDALVAMAEASRRPYITTDKLRAFTPPPEVLRHLHGDDAERLGTVPLSIVKNRQLFVAVAEEMSVAVHDELKILTGFAAVIGVLALPSAIRDAQQRFYRGAKGAIELPGWTSGPEDTQPMEVDMDRQALPIPALSPPAPPPLYIPTGSPGFEPISPFERIPTPKPVTPPKPEGGGERMFDFGEEDSAPLELDVVPKKQNE